MKNFEYFEKEIKKIAAADSPIAAINGIPMACRSVDCGNCDFHSDQPCEPKIIKWLYEEHVEEPKISKRTKQFFEAIQTGWVARDDLGNCLYLCCSKPRKDAHTCNWYLDGSDNYMQITSKMTRFLTLDFIKPEDEEPWSVEDILKLEVED